MPRSRGLCRKILISLDGSSLPRASIWLPHMPTRLPLYLHCSIARELFLNPGQPHTLMGFPGSAAKPPLKGSSRTMTVDARPLLPTLCSLASSFLSISRTWQDACCSKNNKVSGTLRQEPSHLHSLTFPGLISHATVSAYSS